MSIGRTIRIYLDDGSITGIRHAEIVNWTGQAISAPRTQLKALAGWPESNKPGVYFLFGIDDDSGSQAVYIGEAENVLERLGQHLTGKDFWNEVVFFTSKDENLTKSHVKYLESRLVELASAANRYVLLNGNNPQLPSLPRGDRDSMEEFIGNLRTLLGVIGHKALEPVARHEKVKQEQVLIPNPAEASTEQGFTLNHKKLKANAIVNNEGIVVLQGSELSAKVNNSLAEGYRKLRQQLQDNDIIADANGRLIFTRDQLFTSPSQAAAIIVGYPMNGRTCWIDKQGRSIKDLEEQTAPDQHSISRQ
ncbi:methionine sulfoxide reductase A [Zobellella denitrificans]|uniref:GIY-YIG nuclease family protein n=1 Tax=Zobellella denitrificans TaxID=347534 RepID=UPI000B8BE1C4|nr:GIY-YIG nuclease family protein [Zobellella denitrificans]OXS15709.1 methionine sulfoxide reductase A [Zobellella denitrificans]